MCCNVQPQPIQPKPWRLAGEVQERCTTANKVYTIVASIFTSCAVVGVVWGGYDLYASLWGQNSALFTEGLGLLGGAAVSAVISTIAWTCICASNNVEESHEERFA